MNHREAASAVKNALAFLEPLAQVAGAVDQAAKVEQFMLDAGPHVQRLRDETDAAAVKLGEVSAKVVVETARLKDLYDFGVRDVRARVREVEQSLARALQSTRDEHETLVRKLGHEAQDLDAVLVDLREHRDALQSEVDELSGKVTDLKAKLGKIAVAAGGA